MTKAMYTRKSLLGDLLTDAAAMLAESLAEAGRPGATAAAAAFVLRRNHEAEKDPGKMSWTFELLMPRLSDTPSPTRPRLLILPK